MVDDNEAPSLIVAAEQYATVHKYAGAFLQAFTFRSASAQNYMPRHWQRSTGSPSRMQGGSLPSTATTGKLLTRLRDVSQCDIV